MLTAVPHHSRSTRLHSRRPRIDSRTSQRDLVIASLLARPERPATTATTELTWARA